MKENEKNTPPNTKQKTNVLLIMCDQLNASAMDCYGGPVKVPNIRRIADDGVVFDMAFCQTPVCSPSRASLITGLYPHGHGIVSNVMRLDYPSVRARPETEEGINNQDITTDRILHDAGYTTAHYGKWHLLGEVPYYYPDMYREHYEYKDEMSEVFAEVKKQDRATYMDWYEWYLPVEVSDGVRNAYQKLSLDGKCPGEFTERLRDAFSKIGRLQWREEDTFDYKVASKSIDFINKNSEEPFMLTCSFNLPHDPNVIPSPYYEMVDIENIKLNDMSFCDPYFEEQLSRKVPSLMGDTYLKEFLKVYYASVLFIDHQIGRILDTLSEKGLLDDTVLIFMADHGDMAGGHGMFWKSTNSFYNEISRVPLMIRYPSAINRNRYQYPVELIDIMPTILELTGNKFSGNIHGKSLIPYINGDKDGSCEIAVSERIGWNQWNEKYQRKCENFKKGAFMICDVEWKYCIYPDGKEFLFNIKADPGENNNLSNDNCHHEIKSQMKNALIKRLMDTGLDTGNL